MAMKRSSFSRHWSFEFRFENDSYALSVGPVARFPDSSDRAQSPVPAGRTPSAFIVMSADRALGSSAPDSLAPPGDLSFNGRKPRNLAPVPAHDTPRFAIRGAFPPQTPFLGDQSREVASTSFGRETSDRGFCVIRDRRRYRYCRLTLPTLAAIADRKSTR